MSTEEKSVEAKFELLVNVSTLTILTLLRLVKEKGPEAIGEAEMEQFNKVRESVQLAADAVTEWEAEAEAAGSPVDVSRLRSKLDLLIQRIEAWPLELQSMDSTPPS